MAHSPMPAHTGPVTVADKLLKIGSIADRAGLQWNITNIMISKEKV